MRNRKTRAAGLLLCALAAAACGDKYNPDALIRSESNGVETVSNTGNYRPIQWGFDTAFVIGANGDSAFKRIRPQTVAVSKDGHIYILDTTTRRIDIYDAAGKRVAVVPPGANGKLQIPSSLVLQPNGFAVYDVGKYALVSFSPDGKYIGEVASPRQFTQGALMSDDYALVFAQTLKDPKTDSPVISITRVTATDTASVIAARVDPVNNVQFPGCGITMMLPPLFGDPPAWAAANGITAVAEAPLYGVRMYHGTKEYRRVVRRLKPEESNGQYAILAAGDDRKIPMLDGTTCTIKGVDVAKAAGWKESIPAIGAIAITPDGGMWLRRVDPGKDEPAVDIIDAKGVYQGTLPLHTPWPFGFLPDGKAVTLQDDTAGVSHVVVYRVDPNPPKKK